MKVLVIIPAYNESKSIEKVLMELKENNPSIDYLVINDCSKDNTKEVLDRINANYLDLPLNLGIGGGVQSGYIYAKENNYDIVIQLDGDGQHDSSYIKEAIKPIVNDEADCVIGSRFINNEGFQSSFLRRMGIKFLSFLIKFCCGVKIYDVTSGFRAVNREMIELFSYDYASDYPEPEAIVTASINGFRLKEFPVIMRERVEGESSIKSFKSIYFMIKVSLAIIIKRLSGKVRG
ncbi:glycosyltransferase family 2 protein [Anaerofustis stercorihominis]|uniref:glycosyltransferase family 2 protein n=1 Tax=Anaerofustis stercorihominis TaxID=214853 RepID=UPI00214BE76B|nr:glycosyltransferase family 2 protein [Anaerofustis stercorihominis]MCR2033574.1 glycosyltransferase family 2 protein [Anaerofustis stercorihominis]MCR2033579.1 glycosyltransferase family 2 protein [Anaerofustis stercorihominis]